MASGLILGVLLGYFVLLMLVAHFTKGTADNDTFFTGNRNSRWYVVAFGMVGASLSGVTFISVPGWVGGSGFAYMQMVLGYFVGYLIIAFVLLPLYYKHNLTSIYVYLGERFGPNTHLTGTVFFLISRLIGSALRLFLVADVLHYFVFEQWGIPFWATVVFTLVLIWLYTNKGGIKTIVWTDTLQTTFMLAALAMGIYLLHDLNVISQEAIWEKARISNWFVTDSVNAKDYWVKHDLGGIFVAVAMTGLDQDMMQKNLTCKNTKDAKKNLITLATVLIFVNFIFLLLGAYLYAFMDQDSEIFSQFMAMKDSERADRLFPLIALSGKLGFTFGLVFIIGLIAAAYSSADSAITALTTSFCYDILKIDKKEQLNKEKIRKRVHIGVTVVVLITILAARAFKEQNVIGAVFTAANYTYGPLLGLFFFGILTKRKLFDNAAWIICILVPFGIYFLQMYESNLFGAYKFGFELLGINGLFCFLGLWLFSKPSKSVI
jgi:Na+/proline symporter